MHGLAIDIFKLLHLCIDLRSWATIAQALALQSKMEQNIAHNRYFHFVSWYFLTEKITAAAASASIAIENHNEQIN